MVTPGELGKTVARTINGRNDWVKNDRSGIAKFSKQVYQLSTHNLLVFYGILVLDNFAKYGLVGYPKILSIFSNTRHNQQVVCHVMKPSYLIGYTYEYM